MLRTSGLIRCSGIQRKDGSRSIVRRAYCSAGTRVVSRVMDFSTRYQGDIARDFLFSIKFSVPDFLIIRCDLIINNTKNKILSLAPATWGNWYGTRVSRVPGRHFNPEYVAIGVFVST